MKISLNDNWRPHPRARFRPGVYRVPEDMPRDLAEKAVAERLAVWVEEAKFSKAGAPENKLAGLQEPRPLAGSRTGEAKPSPSSEVDQASAGPTSTSSEERPVSSPSTTPGGSADGPMSSTPATPTGGPRKGRPKKTSEG